MTEEKKTKKAVAKAPEKKPVVKVIKKAETTVKEPVSKKNQGNPSASARDRFAVIKTGGKQYVVYEGKTYDFEKLEHEEGDAVKFEEVLLVVEGKDVKIGQPKVEGAVVTGKVISQFRDDKILVLKYKPKKRYRKSYGHRQSKTKVEITKI